MRDIKSPARICTSMMWTTLMNSVRFWGCSSRLLAISNKPTVYAMHTAAIMLSVRTTICLVDSYWKFLWREWYFQQFLQELETSKYFMTWRDILISIYSYTQLIYVVLLNGIPWWQSNMAFSKMPCMTADERDEHSAFILHIILISENPHTVRNYVT